MSSVYHDGELAVQERAGESQMAERNGAVIGDAIMRGAHSFLRQQPMAVLASRDAMGKVWASLVFGQPGFLQAAEDGRSMRIVLSDVDKRQADRLWQDLAVNPQVGMLVIELGTRRRIRINGRATIHPDQVRVEVDESYPNCPKYIQRRLVSRAASNGYVRAASDSSGTVLDDERAAIVRRADTFFVATAHSDRGADASHRGGSPGFVKLLDESTLRIPDYQGNSMFNTLGNLTVNPSAGLAFPDFENRRVLQLTGTADILWGLPDPTGESGGSGRFWDFHLEQWRETPLPNSLTWEFIDFSPFNPLAR